MIKKLLALLLCFAMLLCMTGCGDMYPEDLEDPNLYEEPGYEDDGTQPVTGETAEWAIYWYLCGSDLETNGGFATTDLGEMLEVQLPENVNVVIQTGGSATWHNNLISADGLQRYVYNSKGLFLVDEQPSASMGEADTLAEFLNFASTNYPAKKTAVLFWNHGGGSVTGAAFDELYGFDALTLDEMHAAFNAVWQPNSTQPPLELIGFDTCLMATVDVAATFVDTAHYLVGSQELEPGNGWSYTGWLSALAQDPAMDGAQLGTVICDSFYAGCEEVGTQDNTTLSVTDLTKTAPLLQAYDTFGAAALAAVYQDPGFFSQFARAAGSSENYGGNTREQGYTNMVDLGHLARQCTGILDGAEEVLAALDDCIVYQISGQYRTEASGLSCYYSYNGDVDDFNGYAKVGTGEAFKHYFAYGLTGQLDDAGLDYISQMLDSQVQEMPAVPSLADTCWDGAPLQILDDGTACLDLGSDAAAVLAGIGFSLYYVDVENDLMMMLGTDNDMTADWDNGIFYDNFRGVWGSIDGCLVYMELSYEGEDYNLYSVPVLLNGEEYNLQVAYDFTAEEWYIIGATQGIDDNGMAEKEMRLLKVGDEITTLWYLASFEGEDDFEPYTVETITVTENTTFAETDLPDGMYVMVFEMWDAMGNYAWTEGVSFECADGEIYTYYE